VLLGGGGHQMAAGFTVDAARIDALRDYLTAHIARQLDGPLPRPGIGIDGALTPAAATLELIEALDRAGPFGSGNPRPRFAFADVRLVGAGVVGNGHVRCFVTGTDGAGRLKAIAFRAAGTALGDVLLAGGGAPLHLAGHLDANEWQGRVSAQLVIDDAARPTGNIRSCG
jgi:single-stranded-DNA-specific exonuclease